jgi:hypothetical protein
MKNNMMRKIVRFDLEIDKSMLEYAENKEGKFEDYVERLIVADMRNPNKPKIKPSIYDLYRVKTTKS